MKKIKALYLTLGILIGLLLVKAQPAKVVEVERLVIRPVFIQVEKEVIKEVPVDVIKEIVRIKRVTDKVACAKEEKKNRITLGWGAGFDGSITAVKTGSETSVRSESTFIGKVGYSRKLDDVASIGLTIMSNNSYTLDLGLDY